jgi:uncharacterized protein YecE (DUF72 family)
VEIDSWFYRIPSRADVLSYKAAVPDSFRFTCKVPREITLTHLRAPGSKTPPPPNPDFLSIPRFLEFLTAADPLIPQIDAIMFEFEYLNKQKMPGQEIFQKRLAGFIKDLPAGLPYALEPRNGNYMKSRYFEFIRSVGLIHVYSEKQYMPHVYDLYRDFGPPAAETAVVRLLGGDRGEIEKLSGERWDRIVLEKPDKPLVAGMARDMKFQGKKIIINVNNHYEGSSPLTIRALEDLTGN